MFDAFWTFLKDPANREVLAWVGGGIVVAVGGIWAVVKFFARKPEPAPSKPQIAAKDSVVAGRDMTGNVIHIDKRQSGKR